MAKDGLLVRFIEDGDVGRRRAEVKLFLKAAIRLVPELSRAIFRLLQRFFCDDTELLLSVMQCLLPNSMAVDDLEWYELPAMLSKDELLNEANPLSSAPGVLVSGAYESPHAYLDTYFRLMRLEGFGKLRNGIRSLLADKVCAPRLVPVCVPVRAHLHLHRREVNEHPEPSLGSAQLDHRDMQCYINVEVIGVRFGSWSSPGMTMALTFEVRGRKKEQEIMFGNLLCLTADGTFRDPIWATAANYVAGEKGKRGPTVFVRLLSENNRTDDLGVLLSLLGRRSVMVESPTCVCACACACSYARAWVPPCHCFTCIHTISGCLSGDRYYNAFGPVLHALKLHDPTRLPFEDELVFAKRGNKPAYIFLDSTVNASHVFSHALSAGCEEDELEDESLAFAGDLQQVEVNDFIRMLRVVPPGLETSYVQSQRMAIAAALQQRVAIIQGPPGTGKSTVGHTLIALLQSLDSRPEGPILLLSYKNHALDDVLEACATKGIVDLNKIVRVGSRSKSETLSKRNLSFLMRDKASLFRLDSSREVSACEDKVNELVPLLMRLGKWRESASWLTETAALAAFIECAPIEHVQQFIQRLGRSMLSLLMEMCDKVERCLAALQGAAGKAAEDTSAQETSVHAEPIRESLRYLVNCYLEHRGSRTDELLYTEWNPDLLLLSDQQQKRSLSLAHCVVQLFFKWMPPAASVHGLQRRELTLMLPDSITTVSQSGPQLPTDDDDDAADAQDAARVESRRRLAGDEMDAKDWFERGFVAFDGKPKVLRLSELSQPLSSIEICLMHEHADIWHGTSDSEDRALLLHSYMQERVANLDRQFLHASERYQRACRDLVEMKEKRKADILAGADLVGMTSTGAALNLLALTSLRPPIVIVEEAAELLESQLLAVVLESVQHLIMIGDHKQLRPNVENYELVKHKSLDVSLFERLANNGLLSGTLDTQSRMREEFVPLLKDVYPTLRSHERVRSNQVPSCLQNSMFFWSHTLPEQSERSCKNEGEAQMIHTLTNWLTSEGVLPSQVTIIASYSAQVKLIRDEVRHIEGVHVCTIDEFQGDENDVIIVSLVRSTRPPGDPRPPSMGYLNVQNRLVVASSRARCAMIFVGNAEHLRKCTKRQLKGRHATGTMARWDEVLYHMESRSLAGDNLPLRCPRHPNGPPILLCSGSKPSLSPLHSAAYTISELRGHSSRHMRLCTAPCKAQMACGLHTCKIGWCHPQAEEEHAAHLCTEMVSFKHTGCGHDATRQCCSPEAEQKCRIVINFTLGCGHRGHSACCVPKEMFQCKEMIKFRFLSCGHESTRECSQKEKTLKCARPCARTLPCGHPCPLLCYQECAKANCGACAEKTKVEEEEKQKQLDASLKAARKAAKEEARQHREKGSEYVLRELPPFDPLFHECQRIVHLNQQSDHNNPIFVRRPELACALLHLPLACPTLPCTFCPLQVTRVESVYNAKLETRFLERKLELQDPTAEPVYKFHGTNEAATYGICAEGFRQPTAEKPNMDKKSGGAKLPMYGHGVYLASDSTKSAQETYTEGSNMLLVCKTLLGKSFTANEPDNHMDRKKLHKKGFDSVFAPAGTAVRFDEYIVYDARQAVPRFVVHYQKGHAKMPAAALSALSHQSSEIRIRPDEIYGAKENVDNVKVAHFSFASATWHNLLAKAQHGQSREITQVDVLHNPTLERKFESKQREFSSRKPGARKVCACNMPRATCHMHMHMHMHLHMPASI